MHLEITDNLHIPLGELTFRYDRSSGPGGQNVNKVNTKVTLWWDVATSTALPNDLRERFLARYGQRMTSSGQIQIRSQRFRDQSRNVNDCLEKLKQMVLEVLHPPRERKPSRPTAGSRKRRRISKEHRSRKKQNRRNPGNDW